MPGRCFTSSDRFQQQNACICVCERTGLYCKSMKTSQHDKKHDVQRVVDIEDTQILSVRADVNGGEHEKGYS